MNIPTIRTEFRWSRPHWLGVVVLIFAAQLAFIFLFGARKPAGLRAAFPTPPTTLLGELGENTLPLAELNDPTIFALPHTRGFSGQAWAKTPHREFYSTDWDEPYRWLPLQTGRLGDMFQKLLADNAVPHIKVAEKTEPRIIPLENYAPFTLPAQSSLRLEGSLASRALRVPLELPLWPGNDVLAASEVRVIVDADGRVVSATLQAGFLPNKPDQSKADQEALELARSAQFVPIRPASGLMFGRMVFQWRTIAPRPTETPVTKP